MCVEQKPNEKIDKMGEPLENPPTGGIIWHNFNMCKSEGTLLAIETESTWWKASILTTKPPWHMFEGRSKHL